VRKAAGGPEVRDRADGATLGTMTGAPFTPRRARLRRPRRGSASWWPLVLTAIAIAVVAIAGFALLTRRPAAGGPARSSSPAPSVTPSSAAASPSAAPEPSPSASPARPAAALPPRPHIVADPQPVPILVYHHVLERPKGQRLLVISTRLFRAQMAWLSAHGYQAVTLRRVYDAWTGDGVLPPHPVVLTFDDGYVDQVRNAAPVLRQYRWPAELDLVSGALDLGDDPPATRLTMEMVQGLLNDGWGLESHSVSHPDLTELWGEKLRRQLVDSRDRLEELFDAQIDFFCYPGGIYDRRVKLAVRRAGYLAATGTRYGAAVPRDLFSLGRIYAYRGESMANFGARLAEILAAEAD
jgi:peptidoglycan/xylan/chitin deacetylase (PgdA/CDA1 family)